LSYRDQKGTTKEITVNEELKTKFTLFYEKCKLDIEKKSQVMSFWDEINTITKLGREILTDIRERY